MRESGLCGGFCAEEWCPVRENYQIVCAWAEFRHIDETFAEDDGELCLRLGLFTRRSFPGLGRMIEHQI